MNDSDLLDLLDRRAETAVDLLDRAVADVPVPLPDPGATPPAGGARRATPPWRSPRALAVAAGLLVVALVAAVAVATRDDGSELPVATTGAHRRLVLPPELADGYATVIAAEDLPATSPDLELRVLVPEGAEAPWPDVVIEHVLPASDTTLSGEVVDVGGPEAMFDEASFVPSVGWVDGDTVRYVASATLGRDGLVTLASEIVASGLAPGDTPPGWDLLYSGLYTDVVPTVSLLAGSPHDGAFVAYLDEAEQSGLVVAAVGGGPERWRASYAMAGDIAPIEVRGQDAVLARFDGELVEVSWIEGGDTLVRAWPIGPRPLGDDEVDGFLATLEQLVEVDEAEWARLVAEHPVADEPTSGGSSDGRGDELSGPGFDQPDPAVADGWSEEMERDTDILVSVLSYGEGSTARVLLRRTGDGHQIQGEISGQGHSEAAMGTVASVAGPLAMTVSDGQNLYAFGVVGADVRSVELRSRDGQSIASAFPYDANGAYVFGLIVPDATSLDEVGADRVVGIRSDGTEIVIPLG